MQVFPISRFANSLREETQRRECQHRKALFPYLNCCCTGGYSLTQPSAVDSVLTRRSRSGDVGHSSDSFESRTAAARLYVKWVEAHAGHASNQ